MSDKELRKKLATGMYCRAWLHANGFITDGECDKIIERMDKFERINHIRLTPPQIYSVSVNYNDDATYERVDDR